MCDRLKLNLGSFCHFMMNDWADPAREPGRNVPLLSRFGALKETDTSIVRARCPTSRHCYRRPISWPSLPADGGNVAQIHQGKPIISSNY